MTVASRGVSSHTPFCTIFQRYITRVRGGCPYLGQLLFRSHHQTFGATSLQTQGTNDMARRRKSFRSGRRGRSQLLGYIAMMRTLVNAAIRFIRLLERFETLILSISGPQLLMPTLSPLLAAAIRSTYTVLSQQRYLLETSINCIFINPRHKDGTLQSIPQIPVQLHINTTHHETDSKLPS